MRSIRKPRARHIVGALGLAGVVAVAGVAIAAAPTQTFTGSVSPQVLPKKSFAPAVGKFNLDITSSDANLPPAMQTATSIFDNQVKVEHRGVPVCQPGKLESTTPPQARRACKKAIVGTGFALAKVLFPEDTVPLDAPSPVTMFNGPPKGGNPTIIIHAYTTIPAPTTFIVPGTLRKKGAKQVITFNVPPIAGGYGTLIHFDVKLGRKFKVKRGKKTVSVSYTNAKCAKGKITLDGQFTYADGSSSATKHAAKCIGKNR